MILNEIKLFFENIKLFRGFLNESASENDIIKYIENHEWVYIYYTGDEKTASGYRTIRPYVLGTSKAGNLVLRGWQDNPKNSWHFSNKPTRPSKNPSMELSKNHDFWIDNEGVKPGWRMFRMDKIQKIYPTGKKFIDSNGLVMIPLGYHEGGDDGMTNIIAYVSTKKEPDFDYKYDKTQQGDTLNKNQVATAKWDSIRRGNNQSRKINSDDIVKLSNIASNVYKKGKGTFTVVIDDKKNYQLVTNKDIESKNIPDTAIVGGLANLYDTIVKKNVEPENKFFNDTKNKTLTNLKTDNNTNNKENPTIPFDKKTFFN